jgi:hypothetical protein
MALACWDRSKVAVDSLDAFFATVRLMVSWMIGRKLVEAVNTVRSSLIFDVYLLGSSVGDIFGTEIGF